MGKGQAESSGFWWVSIEGSFSREQNVFQCCSHILPFKQLLDSPSCLHLAIRGCEKKIASISGDCHLTSSSMDPFAGERDLDKLEWWLRALELPESRIALSTRSP